MAKTTFRPGSYRKRRLEVQALRYDGTSECLEAIERWTERRVRWDPNHRMPVVATPQGLRYVNVGDWVVIGVAGECYPIQSDIFEMSYDPAGQGYAGFLLPDRLDEIVQQARQTGDPAVLRGLLDQVVGSHKALLA